MNQAPTKEESCSFGSLRWFDESSPYKRRIMLLRDFRVCLMNQAPTKEESCSFGISGCV